MEYLVVFAQDDSGNVRFSLSSPRMTQKMYAFVLGYAVESHRPFHHSRGWVPNG